MRFGLISNYRRSWSRIGKRALIGNQQEYSNRYLYSAIDPIDGENFHIIGWEKVTTYYTKRFIEVLKEHYSNYKLLLVWDNAPFHKSGSLKHIEGVSICFLPSYSPQLNPVERFFGEMRKVTANRIFRSITTQEALLSEALIKSMQNQKAIQKLTGYQWILEQWNSIT